MLFSHKFASLNSKFHEGVLSGEGGDLLAAVGMEIHALSSASKPLCGWTVRDAIQDCRESCGGHGYLKGKFINYKKYLFVASGIFFLQLKRLQMT